MTEPLWITTQIPPIVPPLSISFSPPVLYITKVSVGHRVICGPAGDTYDVYLNNAILRSCEIVNCNIYFSGTCNILQSNLKDCVIIQKDKEAHIEIIDNYFEATNGNAAINVKFLDATEVVKDLKDLKDEREKLFYATNIY